MDAEAEKRLAAQGDGLLVRIAVVPNLTGIKSRTTIWTMAGAGSFSKPVKIGERAIAWRESDVRRWIASRTA